MKAMESICSANIGRSELSRLIQQSNIIELGADNEYRAISSGSHVDIFAQDQSIGFMQKTITEALDRTVTPTTPTIYGKREFAEIKATLEKGEFGELQHFYDRATAQYKHEEHANREAAIKAFNIKGIPKEHGKQTIARLDTIVVHSMAPENSELTVKMYLDDGYVLSDRGYTKEGRSYPVIITTLPDFVSSDKTVPNAWTKPREQYFNMIEDLIPMAKKAVDLGIRL